VAHGGDSGKYRDRDLSRRLAADRPVQAQDLQDCSGLTGWNSKFLFL
jgi:hypothetical protein